MAPRWIASLVFVLLSPAQAAPAVDPEEIAQCIRRSQGAHAEYPDHVLKTDAENKARSQERARLKGSVEPLAHFLNEFYMQSADVRRRLLSLDLECKASLCLEDRLLILGELQRVFRAVAAKLPIAGFGVHGFSYPNVISGGAWERPMISTSIHFPDAKYDQVSWFRNPELPAVPKTKWEKFLDKINIDALPKVEAHTVYWRVSLMAPLRPEDKRKLAHDADFTAEELLMQESHFAYLLEPPLPTEAEYVAQRVGITCQRILAAL